MTAGPAGCAELLMKNETAALLESAGWNQGPATLAPWSQPATPEQFAMLQSASYGLPAPSLTGERTAPSLLHCQLLPPPI